MPTPTQPPAPVDAATSASADTSGASTGTSPGQPQAGQSDDLERKKREAEIKATGAKLKAEKDALNKQRGEINDQLKALDAERKEIHEFKQWRSQATTDPDAFLKPIYGDNWRDALAKATTGDMTPLAIRQLREEWDKERKERAEADSKRSKAEEETKAEAAKKAAEAEEQSFQEYVKDISTNWMEKHKEEFPTLHATGLGHLVAQKVRSLHKETGKVTDEVEVAKELEAQLDKILDTVYGTKKWSEKLAQKFKPPSPVRKDPPQYVIAGRKAITQDLATGNQQKEKPLTREEKKARLLQNFDSIVPKPTGT